MDITRFNKELGIKIATAKKFEIKGDIEAAIQLWLEISEMALNFSKSRNIDASFKNMIINRTKGIFQHIKNLKSGRIEEEAYKENLESLKEFSQVDDSLKMSQNDKSSFQEKEIVKNSTTEVKSNNKHEIIEDSEFKNLPTGFKEVKTSKEFNIITPHDENFVKKHLNRAEDKDISKTQDQGKSKEDFKLPEKFDFEKVKDRKSLICFACGYDKNLPTDKNCRNCGTKLD